MAEFEPRIVAFYATGAPIREQILLGPLGNNILLTSALSI